MSTNSTTPPSTKVLLGCSKCGATLPDNADFCLKCGKPVSSPARSATVVEVLPPARRPLPPRKRRILLWIFPALMIGLLLWALTSDSPLAQQAQEFVGMKQDRTILDSAFSIGAHTFRYYKFALPEGSVNVAVVGQFQSTADTGNSVSRRPQPGNKNKLAGVDDKIEVYVLTESAFTVWQNGYATNSIYESGRVANASVQADAPAGAGIYYLVFSNKSDPKSPKAVRASVALHYKSWLPDWFRRLKGRVSDWFDSD